MKKVLIIEDDYYIRDIYERTFKGAGYEVYLAKDGEEALQKTKDDSYDLILLDIMLPKVTGIDVLREVRSPGARACNTPLFMITNLGQENIIKESFKLGADGYFIKAQLSPQRLIDEINKYFALKDAHKADSLPKPVQ